MEITIPLALLAGLVSFASPCFLPIVPAFVGQLVGGPQQVSRPAALLNAVSFVAGFSAVFIALWASIGLIGLSLGPYVGIFRVVGGVVLIVMGLHVAGLIEIPLLNRAARLLVRPGQQGALRAGLMGVVFGAGWTPCIGPILGASGPGHRQRPPGWGGADARLLRRVGVPSCWSPSAPCGPTSGSPGSPGTVAIWPAAPSWSSSGS